MDNRLSVGRVFRRGELLVLAIVLVVVLALLLPGMQRISDDGPHTACANNVRQIGLAILNYADIYQGALPALSSAPRGAAWVNGKGNTYPQTLFFALLPFLDEVDLYKAGMNPATNGQTWNGAIDVGVHTRPLFAQGYVKVYVCPADPTNSTERPVPGGWVGGSYAANYQVFGTQNWAPKYDLANIPDGTSNTLCLAERFAYFPGPAGQFIDPTGVRQQAGNLWAWPANCSTSPPTPYKIPVTQNAAVFAYGNVGGTPPYGYGPVAYGVPQFAIDPSQADYRLVQSAHHTVMVGMCDGCCHGVAATVSQPTWQSAILPADGIQLGADW